MWYAYVDGPSGQVINYRYLINISLFLHDIEWSSDDLIVDIGDVECHESEGDEDDTDECHIHEEDSGDIGEAESVDREFIDDDECKQKSREYRHDDTEISDELQWEKGKRSHRVEGKLHEHWVRIRSFAMGSTLRIEDEWILRESEPVDESSVDPIFLRELEVSIDDFAVEEAIVRRTGFELELWDTIK